MKCWLATFLLLSLQALAQTSPYVIPFQGRLTNQQGVPYTSGQYTVVFNIYSQSIGGATQWTERHEKVGVTNGMVSVFLGSISPLPTTIDNPPVAFFSTTRYLGITVDADDNAATADPEMVPRQMIIPAFHAKNADKMAGHFGSFDWSVVFGTGDPATSTVSYAKIPTLTTDKLPDNIPASKLQAGAALANLADSGVSGVSTGGIVLSANANDTGLISAGYTKLGTGQFGEGWKPRRAGTTNAKSQMASVWTGTQLLVWGGVNASGTTVGGGARYTFATDTWSDMTTTNEPAARRLASAVWTGSEMLVWGGVDSSGNPLNTGHAYNPATDTWSPLPASPLAARFYNAVVWTGSEMIIWGGQGGGPLGDGARVKKQAGTWTWQTLPTLNAPGARTDISPTSIWTGTEMLVWGGSNGGATTYNTGSRYNPATDTWATMSTSGAPSSRQGGAVVWSGSEYLVWGGVSGSTYQHTGARYNPATNTWATLSAVNAPPARSFITEKAAWTGTHFIVWGGYDGAYRSDGGLYDPVNNSWMQITSMGVGGRSHHATAWTGTEMLLYGGRDAAGHLSDLVSYTPPRTLYLYQRN